MIPAAPLEVLQHAAQAHASAANASEYMMQIQSLLAEWLPELERSLARVAGSGTQPLDAAAEQLVLAGGKRVRPLATLLVARACGGDASRAIPLAASVELIHSATLLHDDVIDRPVGEAAAHREPTLPGSDDDGRGAHAGRPLVAR